MSELQLSLFLALQTFASARSLTAAQRAYVRLVQYQLQR